MALLSPGVQTTEIDLSVVASNAGSTNGAFGGRFNKGYAGKAVLVNNVSELIENFGKPDNLNFNQWYQAYFFLQYSNGLYVSRAVDENGHWKDAENEVDKVTNLGKVQIKGNPTNIYVGNIVKFSKDSDDEYTIKEIELPQAGQKAKGEISIKLAGVGNYVVTINGKKFTYNSKNADKTTILNGLSQVIDLPNIAVDNVVGEKIEIEMVNPGVPLEVTIENDDLMEYTQTLEPLAVEGFELVFDDETDFTDIAKAGAPIFVKGFSGNAFKFVPVKSDEAILQDLKPLKSKDQLPYEAMYLNEDDFDVKVDSIPLPENYILKIMARTFGEHGNDIQICIAREEDFKSGNSYSFTGVALNNQFEYKPLDSNKEIALLVMVDGNIVEKYIVSLDPNSRDYQNKSLFIDDVIRRKSSVIYTKTNTAIDGLPISCVGENTFKLSNGYDGEIGKSEIENSYGNVSDGAIFGDVESLPIDYVISNEESRTIAGKLAVDRGDCIAIHGATYEIVGQKSTKAIEIMLNDVNTGEMNSGDTRNSYNAYYGNYAMIWDTYGDKYRWINIAGMVAGRRAKTTYENQPWIASAGESQGQLTGITKLAVLPNSGARDKLYVSQINPVTSFPGRGIQIYGQKTLQSTNSAFSRVNVRLLFNYVKRNMTDLLRAYIFQLNDEFTRNMISANLSSFMNRVQTLRGVYEYLVVCDSTNNTAQVIDNNELVVEVALKPTRVAEFIYLKLYAVGSDISISEAVGGA